MELVQKKGQGLIFILGMPRSGTSLTESVLSTSDKLTTGGEKVFFTLQLSDVIKKLLEGDQQLDVAFFNRPRRSIFRSY